MNSTASFRELLHRVRVGDQEAARELVTAFEPKVRHSVRGRLTEMRLRHVLDSGDVCQTVLANFFTRAEDGQFSFATPEDLLRLLVTMARNNVLDEARKNRAGRRDRRRVVNDSDHCLSGVFATDPTPSRIVADRDLAEYTYLRLATDERYLLEQRVAGREWADLAAEQNTTPGALRKKLSRAVRRVTAELFPDATADGDDEPLNHLSGAGSSLGR
ncbi:dna-directed rna polymerase subunit sigma24 : DNA-directed RNA polymerase specialized sigma subunit, sigma24 OS=Singulisphaera acidiphila (strain ATCC BAA-1392 / DSM 18658 / VKM B-2454 / MOB10) GN=Sinac_5214 PE=4 SV=1: Sigma70_ECF [Gemmata massiliana]|uniref:RNA polymerase sigma-70 ECF-like HTH domain-containing protein n=1 Tax=Gemmata massiliana TaxID=1210884 RepID=A0A6P2DKG0_9BACT|nr:ECF-type sigma factor [Gemmata massiliana]VTS02843.1 dna-directed rna polymerase subunit sigma24 : DNA-directed RNA polymerase specialized sigma subunit, sigma24 OS=Singulisphaera acidiphila (strain ATCC BAA-1392 / DSM 18658 / VKM B-2454 / MOB10) GN=Sinac_5214 PE=4 SV=1: Sigma70_ECF [Gemmata massiliana]